MIPVGVQAKEICPDVNLRRFPLPFVRLAPAPVPRYPRLVAQPFDILVRRGAARSHRVNALLDRLKESGAGPVQLRVVIQALLPRGQVRPVQLEHQRIASMMVDCRTPEAVKHCYADSKQSVWIKSALSALLLARRLTCTWRAGA